jgi:hypothetical protein
MHRQDKFRIFDYTHHCHKLHFFAYSKNPKFVTMGIIVSKDTSNSEKNNSFVRNKREVAPL